MNEKRKIATCPECGNIGKLNVVASWLEVFSNPYDYDAYTLKDNNDWQLLYCPVCYNVCLNKVRIIKTTDAEEEKITEEIVFPNKIKQFNNTPAKIIDKYKALIKVIYTESETALVVMRKILEMICKDIGAEGRDLYYKIDYISQQNMMPVPLVKCLNIVRELGNRAAHVETTKVAVDELFNLKQIIETIIEYVYELPHVVDDCYKKYKITNSVNSSSDKTDPYTQWMMDVENFDYNKFKPYWLLKVPDEFLKNKIFSIDTVKTKIKEIIKKDCLSNKHLDTEIMQIYFKYLDN